MAFFYCKSIFHVVLFVRPLMVEISPFGSSAFLLFNICMWKGKGMPSDLCLSFHSVFSLACSVKEQQETV